IGHDLDVAARGEQGTGARREAADLRAAGIDDSYLSRERVESYQPSLLVEVHRVKSDPVREDVSLESEVLIEDADAIGEVRCAEDEEIAGPPADRVSAVR